MSVDQIMVRVMFMLLMWGALYCGAMAVGHGVLAVRESWPQIRAWVRNRRNSPRLLLGVVCLLAAIYITVEHL